MSKLKVTWVSDLHLDFPINVSRVLNGDIDNVHNADVLVIAGDTCEHDKRQSLKHVFEHLQSQYSFIIEIPGNHNYWSMNYNNKKHKQMFESFQHWEADNHVYVNNTTVYIDDIAFVCSCLWSKINYEEQVEIQHTMNDYAFIKNFVTMDSMCVHKRSAKFLQQELQKPGKKIVVSHHLPSYQLIDPCYVHETTNSAYASSLEHMFDCDFEFWIHGHSHSRVDEMILDRRFVRNPLGYPGQDLQCNTYVIEV